MRASTSLAVLVSAGALAGCGSQSSDAGNSASDRSGVVASTAAPTGTVTGVARMYGGPFLNGKMAEDGNPGPGIALMALQNGVPAASVVTGADGGYRFTLAPGNYVLTGCADLTVVVVAGQVNHQDISCPIP